MSNRHAVITGACGYLGKAFTRTLLDEGYDVYALDLNVQKFKGHKRLHYCAVDITDERQVATFFKGVKSVRVLVNNAGVGVFTPFEKRTKEEFLKVAEVNLWGSFLMSRESIKMMKRRNGGKIINVGSIYGVISSDPRIYGRSGRNNSEVYSATKAGVIQMTRYLATYCAKDNIQVNCISPGGIFNYQSTDFVKEYVCRNPMGRMGEPRDLQAAFKFLISDGSAYVTGQNILIDGGQTAW